MSLMTDATPITRRPHFRRHDPPPILIQEDDIAIIRFVYEGRFRRSTDICHFMRHRPAKKIVERLGMLFHTGYLDRPKAQRDYFSANRKRPHYIYALGNAGAELLAQIDGIAMPRIDWGDKNRVTKPFIHHRLLISRTITAIQDAVRARTDLQFIEPAAILTRAPIAQQRLVNPWKFKAKVPTPAGILIDGTAIPDAVFGIDVRSKRTRYYFTLEADRGTMPVWRSTLSKTSLYAKSLAYYHAHKAEFHKRTFNIANFRVLTVTSTPERATNTITMIQKHVVKGGSNLFLFTDIASLERERDVLSLAWTTAKGQRAHLVD